LVAKVQEFGLTAVLTLTVPGPELANTADVPAEIGATPGGFDQLVAVLYARAAAAAPNRLGGCRQRQRQGR
jgi:hypothetical protein